MGKKSRRSWPDAALVATVLAVSLLPTKPVVGLTPNSPEVVQAVAKALKFLGSNAYQGGKVGADVLAGLALLKHGADPSHRTVVAAVGRIQDARAKASQPADLEIDVYSAGLAVIFLAELDPKTYRSDIDFLLAHLKAIQKPHGGWGYPHETTGDTSMTQYGVLGCWKAAKAGIPLPPGMVEGAAMWLLKTQDPNGGFGYQGEVSPTYDPVRQEDVRLSMSAAGLGSLYVCHDLVRMSKHVERDKDGLPPALKNPRANKTRRRLMEPIKIRAELFEAAFARGNRWMEANFAIRPPGSTYIHYYLYTLERYHSYRNLAEGRTGTRMPWYDEAARFLIDSQTERGSWSSACGTTPDTAFGALFLMRSSKKAIEKEARDFGAGILVGGRGLPSDSSIVMIRQGQVLTTPKLEAAEQLLAATDDTNQSEFAKMVDVLPPEEARALISKHARKLKELSGGVSADARLAAVKILGQSSDLDHVPTLIHALTDPEPAVVLEARNGLRRISRRFSGFGLPDKFTPDEVEPVIRYWKEWYLAVRPDANLEN